MMMQDDTLRLPEGTMYYRHSDPNPDHPTVLFLHGLGESGLCFKEAFESINLNRINVVVPDMLGYGRSSPARDRDYTFAAQIQRVGQLIRHLELDQLVLAGHSLGGDLATLGCASGCLQDVLALVNIEGTLTADDTFISSRIDAAARQSGLESWLRNEFMERQVLGEWGARWPSCRRYYTSLHFACLEALVANAKELVQRNCRVEGSPCTQTGQTFADLEVLKVYCWGENSVSNSTRKFILETLNDAQEHFQDSFHWPMIDQTEAFYGFLERFIVEHIQQEESRHPSGLRAEAPES